MEPLVTAAHYEVDRARGAVAHRRLGPPPPPRAGVPTSRPPGPFLARVFALSIPFWLLGLATDAQLLPGLSVSVLAALCPLAAALMLVGQEGRTGGVKALLLRSLDWRRIRDKRWYVPVLLLMPFIDVLVYGSMRWMDLPLPLPLPRTAVLPALLMFLVFFVGALGEELGWSGYLLDPMQQRRPAWQAGAILGAVAVVWHLVPLLLMQRPPAWIAWWALYALASRVLIVWLYNNTGRSVFAVALFHATLNLSFALFPVAGSHFDMRLGGLATALAAAIVLFVWGPRTLVRSRPA